MPLLTNRLALAVLCLLPGVTLHANVAGRPLVASFMYACDSSTPQPKLTTRYTAAGKPTPKPSSAIVEMYEKDQPPPREFDRIGRVEVLANSGRMSVSELEDWARRGARKLGGDALVDMTFDDAASVTPKAGPVGVLYLTADVVRWR